MLRSRALKNKFEIRQSAKKSRRAGPLCCHAHSRASEDCQRLSTAAASEVGVPGPVKLRLTPATWAV